MRKLGKYILTGQSLVEKWLSYCSGTLLAVVMLLTSSDVIMRYVLKKPISGAYELTGLLVLTLVCLSFAYVQGKRQHITLNFLPKKLPPRGRAVVEIIAFLVGLAFFGAITYQGGRVALDSVLMREFSAGIVRFPVYPVRVLVVVGAGLMCLRLIMDIIGEFAHLLGLSTK